MLDTASVIITAGGNYRVYQQSTSPINHTITIHTHDSVTLVIDNLNISTTSAVAPIYVGDSARVRLNLKRTNLLVSTNVNFAALRVGKRANLTIAKDSAGATLSATGGASAAAIGTNYNDSCGIITIQGGIITTAGAGIGKVGSSSSCAAVRIMGGTITSNIVADNVRISGGSVKGSVAGGAGDPKDDNSQQVFLGKFSMANACAVWVGGIPYNVDANHVGDDTLYLYIKRSTAADNDQNVYVLVSDGRLMYVQASFVSVNNIFTYTPPFNVFTRDLSQWNITSSFQAEYKHQYNSNPTLTGTVIATNLPFPSMPLNNAAFNEYIITFNGIVRSRFTMPDNMLPDLNGISLDITGLTVAGSPYPLTIEYGGNRRYHACRIDTTLTITKAVPYTPDPVERSAIYLQQLRDATPALDANWTWVSPTTTLNTIGLRHSDSARYTPDDTDNLQTIFRALPVRVYKKPSTPEEIPTIYTSYGTPLQALALPEDPNGKWLWLYPDLRVDSVDTIQNYTAVYIPTDSVHYATVNTKPTMIVSRAKPSVALPLLPPVSYGETLSIIKLDTFIYDSIPMQSDSGMLYKTGWWRWDKPSDKVGKLGRRCHAVIFDVADAAHYDTLRRQLCVDVIKPKGFIKINIDGATPDTTRGDFYYLVDDCQTDTAVINFVLPPGVTVFEESREEALTTFVLPLPRPNVYVRIFNIITVDTSWDETVLIERRFKMSNIIYTKFSSILMVGGRSAVNGGYTFNDLQTLWYRGDTLLESCSNMPYCVQEQGLDTSARYHVELTMMPDAVKIRTCPDKINIRTGSAAQVKIYPNPAPQNSIVTIVIPDEMRSAIAIEVKIYDAYGTLKDAQVIDAADPRMSLRKLDKTGIFILKMNIGEARLTVW
jgi:hypothetical protein